VTAPAVGGENDCVKHNLTDERSDFKGDDGNLAPRTINFEFDLLALHGLLEHRIRFGFRGIGNIFVIGGIVRKNLVGDAFSSGGIAISQVESDYEQG
jgi:hypothetical protein